jgi:hypothetical protein
MPTTDVLRDLVRRVGFKSDLVDLVHRDFTIVCIVVGLVLIVASHGWTEFKRRKNESAKLKLEKMR